METLEKTNEKPRLSRGQGMLIMILMISFSLAIGMAGFHLTSGLDWTDSFLNASMLLTGMGPMEEPESSAGKIFAGVYALYCGIVFLSSVAIFLYPVLEHMGKHVASGSHRKTMDDCE